jgi:hypothetical protein
MGVLTSLINEILLRTHNSYLSPVPTRVIRKIPNDGPVLSISSTDIACNQGGNVGTNDTFDVNAGSDMTFKWTNVRFSVAICRSPSDLLLCH